MIKVSIIVPCFNQAEYLEECLQSILDQTYHEWECIIVNDGSPDNTEDIALNWCNKDIRFRYISKENGGLSSARNKGINVAVGEYILPLDADDKISDNYIELCVSAMLANADLKLVYGHGKKFGAVNEDWALPPFSFQALLISNMIFCTALYRKKDWLLIGGYDEKMKHGLEDWDFWISLLKNGGTVFKQQNCIFWYRVKHHSMIEKVKEDRSITNDISNYLFVKHLDVYCKEENAIHIYYACLKYDKLLKRYNSLIKSPESYLTFGAIMIAFFNKCKRFLFKISK